MESIDLGTVVKKNDNNEGGVWVPWDEEAGCAFQLAYMGRKALKKAKKDATEETINTKTHRIEQDLNDDKLDISLMDCAIIGWRGLLVKHLKDILDPTLSKLDTTGVDPEAEIKFTPENKQLLLECYNPTFSQFVTGISTRIETYQKLREEQAEKNSESSQAG